MIYQIKLKPRALKDLKTLDQKNIDQILAKIELLQDNLRGDLKKLTNFTPEYRLRVGKYRVLFEIEGNQIIIYRIKHRSQAYQ